MDEDIAGVGGNYSALEALNAQLAHALGALRLHGGSSAKDSVTGENAKDLDPHAAVR
jgi:hypothetical protein